MSNRTGKREREARSRTKRGHTYGVLRNGTILPALKLGRKKRIAWSVSNRCDVQFSASCTAHPRDSVLEWWKRDMAAVPVAEAERR